MRGKRGRMMKTLIIDIHIMSADIIMLQLPYVPLCSVHLLFYMLLQIFCLYNLPFLSMSSSFPIYIISSRFLFLFPFSLHLAYLLQRLQNRLVIHIPHNETFTIRVRVPKEPAHGILHIKCQLRRLLLC